MRTLPSILLLLFFLSGFSQSKISFEVCRDFSHNKIVDLNQKLFVAVMEGKVEAYANDSFNRKLTVAEVEQRFTVITRETVPNPDNPEDPYDLIDVEKRTELNPNEDLIALGLSSQLVRNSSGVSYELLGASPLYDVFTPSGIGLGRQPLFFVSINDLRRIVSKEEFTFYNELFLERMAIGDFRQHYLAPFTNPIHQGDELSDVILLDDHLYQEFGDFQDSILGYYFNSLFVKLADKANKDGFTFYHDKEMSKPIDSIEIELADSSWEGYYETYSYEIGAVNELKYKYIYFHFSFNSMVANAVYAIQEDYIIHLTRDPRWGIPFYDKDVYFSYNKISKYISPRDKIVVDELLKEISK